MKLVIDTNIFIAGLLKNGKIRELIVNSKFDLFMPEIVYEEIIEHKRELLNKSALSEQDFNHLSSLLSGYIKIIPNLISKPYKEEAERIMHNLDKDDAPIVAVSLLLNACPIWSDDLDFKKQSQIKIFTTQEIIQLIES